MSAQQQNPFAYVIAVKGSKMSAVMANAATDAKGNKVAQETAMEVQIGSMVKIFTSKSVAFGIIQSLSVPSSSSGGAVNYDTRMVEIDLMGEAMLTEMEGDLFKFNRGVSVYPALWSAVYLAGNEDLAQIYARPDEASVRIGTIHQDSSIPAYILMDKLLGMHFAVLGNTGAGKSCTMALLLRAILQSHPQGRVLLMDPHNEYSKAFTDMGEVMNTSNLTLPYWVFNAEEMQEILIDRRSETYMRECSLMRGAIMHAKMLWNSDRMDSSSITIDSPIPYQMRDVIQYLDEKMGELEQPDGIAPYLRLKTRITQIKNDSRYNFLFPGLVVTDSFSEFLARLMRLPVAGKPITVFDLSAVPSEIVDVVVSVLCRVIFDFAVVANGRMAAPMLLVCEEAHRYVPRDENVGFGPTRKLVARIAQEGRKYGIGLGLVTQRPALISETILSQCNTIICLRMNNETDQMFARKAMPESGAGLSEALSALRRQEAIISGEGVTLPMRIRFANLPEQFRPRSDTQPFSERWAVDDWTSSKVEEIVALWRRQTDGNVKKQPSILIDQPATPRAFALGSKNATPAPLPAEEPAAGGESLLQHIQPPRPAYAGAAEPAPLSDLQGMPPAYSNELPVYPSMQRKEPEKKGGLNKWF